MGEAEVLSIGAGELVLRPALDREPPPPSPVALLLALPRPKILRRVLQAAAAMGVKRLALVGSWRVEKSYFASPLLSPDGSMVLFKRLNPDDPAASNFYILDLSTGRSRLAAGSRSGAQAGQSSRPTFGSTIAMNFSPNWPPGSDRMAGLASAPRRLGKARRQYLAATTRSFCSRDMESAQSIVDAGARSSRTKCGDVAQGRTFFRLRQHAEWSFCAGRSAT